MTYKYIPITCQLLLLLSVTGCSTPASVRETASHSISLISELDSQLNQFKAVEARSELYLVNKTKQIRKESAALRLDLKVNDISRKAADNNISLELSRRLESMIADLDSADQSYKEAILEIDANLTNALVPLPSTTKSLTATQAALAPLTKEVSSKDRLKEVSALIKVVRDGISDSEEMIKQANVKSNPTQK